jgi:GxxExxY protein
MNRTEESAQRNLNLIADRVVACAAAARKAVDENASLEECEEALHTALRADKLQFARQYPFGVPFHGPQDRGFRADYVVQTWLLVVLKHVDTLAAEHEDLALNYMRESGCKLCLLINFGRPKIEVRRLLPLDEADVLAAEAR